MDRFIDLRLHTNLAIYFYLKSNMDRFIDLVRDDVWVNDFNLKSNMDRFIDVSLFSYSTNLNI